MFISSTAVLNNTGNTTYTSGAINADRIDSLTGYVRTDQAGNIYIEQTFDGTNWDISDTYPVVAGTSKTFTISLLAPLVRIRYVNSGSTQTYFRLYAKGASAGDS